MKAIILTFLTLFLSVSMTDCLPWQAGHCDEGTLAGKSGKHGDIGGGDLVNGSLQLSIDGNPLTTGNRMSLESKKDYTFTLVGVFQFRGFLIRLADSRGLDSVFGAFTVADGDTTIKMHPNCDDSVSAVTHPNRLDKLSIEFTFNLDKAIEDIRLDVTVVKDGSQDNFYYSKYELEVTGGESPETSAPVKSPTIAPAKSPTSAPVKSPTNAPIKSSTSAPAKIPTSAPVNCVDSRLRMVVGKRIRWCGWAKKNSAIRCEKRHVANHCRKTCDGVLSSCDDFGGVDSKKKFIMKGGNQQKSCVWVSRNGDAKKIKRCKKFGVASTCPETCSGV